MDPEQHGTDPVEDVEQASPVVGIGGSVVSSNWPGTVSAFEVHTDSTNPSSCSEPCPSPNGCDVDSDAEPCARLGQTLPTPVLSSSPLESMTDSEIDAMFDTPLLSESESEHPAMFAHALDPDNSSDSGSNSDREEVTRRPSHLVAPSLVEARSALRDITKLLSPPRKTGRGHKDPKLLRFLRMRLEFMRTFLFFFVDPSSPIHTMKRRQHSPWTAASIIVVQDLYFGEGDSRGPSGVFKGMDYILEERGVLNAHQMKAQCKKKFDDCPPAGASNCCCRRTLYNQPDFTEVKSELEIMCNSRGVELIVLPKFHPELNFIEQVWGNAKRTYRMYPPSSTEADLERNLLSALKAVSLTVMRRYHNRSLRFSDAYRKGLNGMQAAWANKRYHGHRLIPESILRQLDAVDQ